MGKKATKSGCVDDGCADDCCTDDDPCCEEIVVHQKIAARQMNVAQKNSRNLQPLVILFEILKRFFYVIKTMLQKKCFAKKLYICYTCCV